MNTPVKDLNKLFQTYKRKDADTAKLMLLSLSELFNCEVEVLARVFVQAEIYGYMMPEDMYRIISSGIPLWHELQKIYDVDDDLLIYKVKSRTVKFETMFQALQAIERRAAEYKAKHIPDKSPARLVLSYLWFRFTMFFHKPVRRRKDILETAEKLKNS